MFACRAQLICGAWLFLLYLMFYPRPSFLNTIELGRMRRHKQEIQMVILDPVLDKVGIVRRVHVVQHESVSYLASQGNKATLKHCHVPLLSQRSLMKLEM